MISASVAGGGLEEEEREERGLAKESEEALAGTFKGGCLAAGSLEGKCFAALLVPAGGAAGFVFAVFAGEGAGGSFFDACFSEGAFDGEGLFPFSGFELSAADFLRSLALREDACGFAIIFQVIFSGQSMPNA